MAEIHRQWAATGTQGRGRLGSPARGQWLSGHRAELGALRSAVPGGGWLSGCSPGRGLRANLGGLHAWGLSEPRLPFQKPQGTGPACQPLGRVSGVVAVKFRPLKGHRREPPGMGWGHGDVETDGNW